MAGTQQSFVVPVLGASGKLGRMLCVGWRPLDWRVLPVVRRDNTGGAALTWQPGRPFACQGPVKAIVALWGVTPGPGRDLADNARLAAEAMSLGEALAAEAVVHCSSAAVYRPGPLPLDETTRPDPLSDYGRAKLEMERTILDRAVPGSPRQVVLRIGNVAGADSLFANLRPGGEITLDDFGGGRGPARSYIAPSDLFRVIEALIRDPEASGIYNVAAPRPTAMEDIVRAAGAAVCWRPALAGAFPMMWLDTGRLSRHLVLPDRSADPGWLISSARETGVWG